MIDVISFAYLKNDLYDCSRIKSFNYSSPLDEDSKNKLLDKINNTIVLIAKKGDLFFGVRDIGRYSTRILWIDAENHVFENFIKNNYYSGNFFGTFFDSSWASINLEKESLIENLPNSNNLIINLTKNLSLTKVIKPIEQYVDNV